MGGQNCGTRFLAIFHFVYMEASRKSHSFHLEPAQPKVCGGLADRVIKKIPGPSPLSLIFSFSAVVIA